MSGVKKIFKLQYIIGSEIKSVNLNHEDKFNALISIITAAHKIKIQDYELLYRNTKVTNFDKTFKDIVGSDMSPIFHFNKVVVVNNKQTNNKQTNNKPVNMPADNPQSPKFITYAKVLVENYPTRPELFDHLNKFLAGSKEYTLQNADTVLGIIFKNSVSSISYLGQCLWIY
jgi:hypothetical protein